MIMDFEDVLMTPNSSNVETEGNGPEDEVKEMFLEILGFLKKFAVFLNTIKNQKLIVGDDLAEISEEFRNYNNFAVVNVKDILTKFNSELTTNNIQIDVNTAILQFLSSCLLYVINQLRDEDANVPDIFQYFLDVKKSFAIFIASPSLLDTKELRELISSWIVDLLKIITEADGVSRNDPKQLKIFNVIRSILTTLARYDIYCELILKQISNKLECALSYYRVRADFRNYIASKTMIFVYLLWILNSCVKEANGRGYTLNRGNILSLRRKLLTLDKCLHDQCPSVIRDIIEDFLRNTEYC